MKSTRINPFADDDATEQDFSASNRTKRKRPEDLMEEDKPSFPRRTKGSRRWDTAPKTPVKDVLDQFMDKLEAGAEGRVTIESTGSELSRTKISVHVGNSMTANVTKVAKQENKTESTPQYGPKDWLSDVADTDDEELEEKGRRALIEALVGQPGLPVAEGDGEDASSRPALLAAEVKSEKERRKAKLEELERQAEEARRLAEKASEPDVGRLYNDAEEGVMEEAQRNLEAAKAAPDALTVLAELNKKKELKAVDHSKIEYMPFQKNLYRVPRSLANLTHDEVINLRAKLKVRVRGHGAPAPVSTFEECGLSERILSMMEKQNIRKPFPIQAQCVPLAMAGRDVIGIAKTGSGKTLSYLLPLLRHVLVQPPLDVPYESGPIGLIMAPARELAFQIHSVCKSFAKQLGLKTVFSTPTVGACKQCLPPFITRASVL